MKTALLSVLCLSLLAISCKSTSQPDGQVSKADTLETASGLKYYYVKKGTGPEVVSKSTVSAVLSLTVNDKVVWKTAGQSDSLFTFTVDESPLIKGFNEMALLLREGDEVVAIMHPGIAYGSRGMGEFVPPNTTIIYDRFKVVKVDPPKH